MASSAIEETYIGMRIEQQPHDRFMSMFCCQHECCHVSIVFRDDVHIGMVLQEQFGEGEISVPRRDAQQRHVNGINECIRIGGCHQEQFAEIQLGIECIAKRGQ